MSHFPHWEMRNCDVNLGSSIEIATKTRWCGCIWKSQSLKLHLKMLRYLWRKSSVIFFKHTNIKLIFVNMIPTKYFCQEDEWDQYTELVEKVKFSSFSHHLIQLLRKSYSILFLLLFFLEIIFISSLGLYGDIAPCYTSIKGLFVLNSTFHNIKYLFYTFFIDNVLVLCWIKSKLCKLKD